MLLGLSLWDKQVHGIMNTGSFLDCVPYKFTELRHVLKSHRSIGHPSPLVNS